MQYDKKTGKTQLITGRRIYVHAGVFGLMTHYDHDVLTGGYDVLFDNYDPSPDDLSLDPEYYAEHRLTPAERKEIADFMVARWQAWASRTG